MAMAPVKPRKWTRREYDRLISIGWFGPEEKLELLDGEILEKMTQGTPHMTGICLATDALRLAFGQGFVVRAQGPIALDDMSEPEPDLAVVRGAPRDFLAEHPGRPELILEVADSSLDYDRTRKGSLYARAGLTDYWILNIPGRLLEVYRDPRPDALAYHGWAYKAILILHSGESIAPLAMPDFALQVSDFLP